MKRSNKMRKFRKNPPQKQQPQVQSMVGAIIDMSEDEFKEELVNQKVNVGVANNLILHLSSIYEDLKRRKDGVISLVIAKDKTEEEVKSTLGGLYAEMMKIERKVELIKEYRNRFLRMD